MSATVNEQKLLMEYGFNLYESRIICSLVSAGKATAKYIAQDAAVPKNKVYEILESLLQRGLVQLLPGKPKRYAATSLPVAIERNIRERTLRLEQVGKTLKSYFNKLPKKEEQPKKFWAMEGKSAMVNKIVETLDSVQKESLGFIDIWTARPENLSAIKRAIDRGVKFYFLGSVNKKTLPLVKKYEKLGVKIKNYNIRGAGYSVFDGRYVQQRITEGKIISLWIENVYLAKILREHFFDIWKKVK